MSYHNVLVSEGFLGYWLLVTSTISRDLDQSRAVEDSRSLCLQALVTREQSSTCWAPCVVCFAFLGRGDMSNLVRIAGERQFLGGDDGASGAESERISRSRVRVRRVKAQWGCHILLTLLEGSGPRYLLGLG